MCKAMRPLNIEPLKANDQASVQFQGIRPLAAPAILGCILAVVNAVNVLEVGVKMSTAGVLAAV